MKKLSAWARGLRYGKRSFPALRTEAAGGMTEGELTWVLANAYYKGFVEGKKRAAIDAGEQCKKRCTLYLKRSQQGSVCGLVKRARAAR